MRLQFGRNAPVSREKGNGDWPDLHISLRETKIGVVVINWNGWQNSIECLKALRSTIGPKWHLYLVDNASEDDSLNHLIGLGEDVTLIQSTINAGWTGGNNIGVQRALAAGHEFIFILNNDAFVQPNTLSVLVSTFLDSDTPMPILGPLHKRYGEDKYDFVGFIDDHPINIESAQTINKTYGTWLIKGAGLFVHREHFQKVGYFDDRFFLNWDDSDWCLRASKAGYSLLMVRDAVINHIGSASMGGAVSPLQAYFMARNLLLFGEKHLSIAQRVRQLRSLAWQARDLSPPTSPRLWLADILLAESGSCAAFRRGIIDYFLRRFGDCPAIIREWNEDASKLEIRDYRR
jgi:GT2 family glycosyltransferase